MIYITVFVIGTLILNSLLYKSRLVPRFISIWGLIAALDILVGPVASIFVDIPAALAIIIVVPIAVQEMVLAIWLIVKGFNPAVIAADSADADHGQLK